MGKVRGNWGHTAVDGAIRGRKKSALKMRRRWLVSLAFLCAFLLGPNSYLFAATSCSESCIVTTNTYITYVQPPSIGSHGWLLYDYGAGCEPITLKSGSSYTYTPGMIKYYIRRPIKWYWDVSNRRWVSISIAPYGTYAPELPAGIYWGGSAEQLFPNGCSDLPSQQPDQTPNPDTGKPKCSNQISVN